LVIYVADDTSNARFRNITKGNTIWLVEEDLLVRFSYVEDGITQMDIRLSRLRFIYNNSRNVGVF